MMLLCIVLYKNCLPLIQSQQEGEWMQKAISIDAGTEELIHILDTMISPGRRFILGIAGIPGAGKSTLASRLEGYYHTRTVAMDGFHLFNSVLRQRNLEYRKGAPETFDLAGFLECLHQLRNIPQCFLPVPGYSRIIHDPVPGEIMVRPDHDLIIVEGNYLLLNSGGWEEVRRFLDAVWFVDIDIDLAMQRVRYRHRAKNISEAEIEEKITLNDRPNALLVEESRFLADMIIYQEQEHFPLE